MGKANNLRNRVSSYFKAKNLGEKTKQLVSQIHKIKLIAVNSEVEAFLLEENLVKKYKPKYNLKLQDDKSFQRIKITIKDKYPKVLIVRKQKKDGSLYFGPYTNSTSLKTVLKIIRKIFPYQAVSNHQNRLCFYNHLGLCPCPSVTSDKSYKKTIKYIISFLNGKTKEIINKLQKERDNYSKKEDFENAKLIQNKINSIKNVTTAGHKPFEYEENPNLKYDVINNQLDTLKKILLNNSVLVKNLNRIECFDISNISGFYATGSMVVFTNGEKDTSSYKRFKIKRLYNNKPNDFAMMQEILERRFKRKDWKMPSLVIIDGGKGQVSSVRLVFEKLNINIPLIGLAKKEETIITGDLNEIVLSKNSVALHLIMRIRDEAHRFAIAYHKKLRSKLIFS
ncbi:MAG: UvrB/UvrC motif-containing protein [Patescibacteria group bacterium]